MNFIKERYLIMKATWFLMMSLKCINKSNDSKTDEDIRNWKILSDEYLAKYEKTRALLGKDWA